MDSSNGMQRKSWGLKFTVKNIFRNPKTHTGPGPAPDDESRWGNTAEKPVVLSSLHEAVRNNDMAMVNRVLEAFPHELYETDDRKCCHDSVERHLT